MSLLVTSGPNVAYLSGFSGSNGALLVDADDPARDLLGTDSRYAVQAAKECGDLPALLDRDTVAALVRARAGTLRLVVEASISVGVLDRLRSIDGVTEVQVRSGLVEPLRAAKEPGELHWLGEACRITAAAMTRLLDEIRVGQSEIEIARRLEQLFGELGAPERAFPTIVGSGPNAAVPHHQPSFRRLEAGDLLVIDAGARVGGYHADMTRTAVVGADPTPWQTEIHAATLLAQGTAMEMCRSGACVREIDAVARGVIAEAGFGPHFSHGLGHGIGLEIHEAPMLGPASDARLLPGSAITIEPGIYLPGLGGVRIEDSLVVGTDAVEILTEAPRSLQVVG